MLRLPYALSQAEMTHPDFEDGISCHHCKSTQDPARTIRFAERQRQIKLAKERGQEHLGVPHQSKIACMLLALGRYTTVGSANAMIAMSR